MLHGKKILLGISGSIAAYKSAVLIRLLVKAGAEVKVVMTPSATEFIGPLTLSTLSRNEVLTELTSNHSWVNHVMLGRWADIMVIAPLSCNTLSKMANGLCDNLLIAVYLSATCPVVVAPAMDEDMWIHPATKKNIETLCIYGNTIIPVNHGELASGLNGAGRMSEPEEIIDWLSGFFLKSRELEGKKVLVTAGPTHEAIDPVRFIGNHSSGKMGLAIARECKKRGADVTLIMGPGTEQVTGDFNTIPVKTAAQMYEACMNIFPLVDIAVMSAAVADYTVAVPSDEKIKKTSGKLVIELQSTKDILKTMGENKRPGQFLVGFALETNNEKEFALKKLQAKHADIIVLNSLNDEGSGFGHNTNKITIFDSNGREYGFERKLKTEVASDIVDLILNLSHA